MNLSKSLKIAKAKHNVKNKQIAEALGVTEPLVSRWCVHGNYSRENTVRLAEFFGMPVSEFIALGEDS